MNPSTYLYLHYDYEYKYGLKGLHQALNHYPPALIPVEALWQRLRDRNIAYLMGSKDRGVGDERPEAMQQGSNRQARFQAWLTFLDRQGFPTNDTFFTVAGVSHDAGQM